jgi:hypothetical protein
MCLELEVIDDLFSSNNRILDRGWPNFALQIAGIRQYTIIYNNLCFMKINNNTVLSYNKFLLMKQYKNYFENTK